MPETKNAINDKDIAVFAEFTLISEIKLPKVVREMCHRNALNCCENTLAVTFSAHRS
ncbi:hypothetical protein [Grimontia indica]|uniref:hypothetical protein n=1 Tax=Grimontia indica TaxID=1056512 RepID=UPI001360B1B9|nr:hypothetical protein [Grimontia indica]